MKDRSGNAGTTPRLLFRNLNRFFGRIEEPPFDDTLGAAISVPAARSRPKVETHLQHDKQIRHALWGSWRPAGAYRGSKALGAPGAREALQRAPGALRRASRSIAQIEDSGVGYAPTHTLCANPHPVRQPSTRPSLPNAWNLWPRPLPYAPTFDPAHSLDLRARPSGRQGKPGDWLPDGRRGTRLLRHFEEVALGVAVPADGQTDVALLGVGVSLTAYYDRENLSSETQEDHRIPKIAFAMSTQRRRRERSPSIV